MKKNISYFLAILFLVWSQFGQGQSFTKAHQSHIQANQVITEHFFSIALQSVNNTLSGLNTYDIANPYTFIQAIQDDEGKMYQILYQTDFSGNLLYLGMSNNLNDIFSNPEKSMMKFNLCISRVNQSLFVTENIELAVGCVIDRLNDFRQNQMSKTE